jgi:hypothetical protein
MTEQIKLSALLAEAIKVAEDVLMRPRAEFSAAPLRIEHLQEALKAHRQPSPIWKYLLAGGAVTLLLQALDHVMSNRRNNDAEKATRFEMIAGSLLVLVRRDLGEAMIAENEMLRAG